MQSAVEIGSLTSYKAFVSHFNATENITAYKLS